MLRRGRLLPPPLACLGELAHCYALLGDVAAAEAALAEADAATVPSFVMDHSFIELSRAWTAHARGEFSRARRRRDRVRRALRVVRPDRVRGLRLARRRPPRRSVDRRPSRSSARSRPGRRRPGPDASPPTRPRSRPATPARSRSRGRRRSSSWGGALRGRGVLPPRRACTGATAGPAARSRRPAGRSVSSSDARERARRRSPTSTPRCRSPAGSTRSRRWRPRGLTNRQIAERLVVSVRTVDNHLHNAFGKLGVTHRAMGSRRPIVLHVGGSRPQP